MYSQTSAQTSAAFDAIYAKVPAEQVEKLKEFRRAHPYKRLTFNVPSGIIFLAGVESRLYFCFPEHCQSTNQLFRSSRLLRMSIASSRHLTRCR
jgi:hypothetical protein